MNEKPKPSQLSPDDMDTATKLLGLDDTGKPDPKRELDKGALIQFLDNLEKKYEVIDFPDDDFKINPKNHSYLPKDHAGRMYSNILIAIITLKNNDDKMLFSDKIIKYFNRQIRRYSKNYKSYDRRWVYRKMVAELGMTHIQSDRYNDFAMAYYKYLKIYIKGKSLDDESTLKRKSLYDKSFWKPFLGAAKSKLKMFKDRGTTMFGNNPKLHQIYCRAISYAQDNEPCLILGETGTGKELIAEMMHVFSPRKSNDFIPRNVSGYPLSLFESEVFGVKKGAFTGSIQSRIGALLMACGRSIKNERVLGYNVNKNSEIYFKPRDEKETTNPTKEQLNALAGTVFLDEINSIDSSSQSKLLRAIEQKEVQVVGEEGIREFRAKIICAANKEGVREDAIWSGRQDLFFRFKQIIELPPLRDMADSIPEIAKLEIKNLAKKIGIKKISISQNAINKLQRYNWPGNFRQLSNVLYRAIKNANLDGRIEIEFDDIKGLLISEKEMDVLEQVFDDLTLDQLHVKYVNYLPLLSG